MLPRAAVTCYSISVVGEDGVKVNTSILIVYIDILFLRTRIKQVKSVDQEGEKRSNNYKGMSLIYL